MNTYQISECLASISSFAGVFALDQLINFKFKYSCTIIVNLDESYKPGSHWVAIALSHQSKSYYFDSYGLAPFKKELIQFLLKHVGNNWTWNRQWLQSVTSDVCGIYCVVFVVNVHKDVPMYIFLSNFDNRLELNDCKIRSFFKNSIKCSFKPSVGQSCKSLHNVRFNGY